VIGFTFVTCVCSVIMLLHKIPEECLFLNKLCLEKTINSFMIMTIKYSITVYGNVLIAYTSEDGYPPLFQ
jgi:hypothetical protein